MAGLTDSTFFPTINGWFEACTLDGNTLIENTTGIVYETYGPMATWNTSAVTDMTYAFSSQNAI